MDNWKRQLLQRYQADIVKDLDVEFVIDTLFTKYAITGDDIEEINNRSSRKDRARHLVDILLQNGSNSAFEAFVDSLAKNYDWLWKKLVVENNEPIMNESFEDSLSRGDVPRLPVHYVKRIALEQDIETKLSVLPRHKILALHGMSGSGKTTAVISVLRDNSELITNNFNGVVFWLNLANCKTEDDIIAQQNKLYRKASSIYARNSHMNSTMSMSSIGSNIDSQSLSSYEWTWLDLRDRLKSQFSERALKEALLVLDEVNEKLGVEAFDIGCKILVTTRDSEVVSNFHPQIIKVENSLKEEETLKLLASYVDLDVHQLPRQAKKFHDACKGSPFNIGLIGAQLAEDKERLNHDNKRWNYYLKQLEKKDFLYLLRHNDNQMKTIEVCINSLEPNILPLFKRLAILPDNVKVSVKVLAKLWHKEISEVEIIMRKLRVKSLIIEMYDHDRRNYMYEVHDLIMTYLKGVLSEEEKKKLHSDFLKSYQYDVNKQPPVDITDDGYIAYYIGYHVLHTKNLSNRWALFNKLYLDLKFLGNKVRLTGPADVILDLQKYEAQIVHDELDRDLLCTIRAYISTHGIDLYRYPSTDIVQSILQHESKGLLYTKAWDLATTACAKNELYFEFLHEQDVEEIKYSTIDVKETISAVCFLGDYVLVGTYTGLVKFFHIPTNKLKKELAGSGAIIKWVGACPVNPPRVAALSFDGFIKMWYIDDEREDNDDVIDEESEEQYNNNCVINCTIPPKRGAFLGCRWANHQEVLVAHTAKMIILYNADGSPQKVYDNFERDQEILCCSPCNYDKYLIAAVTSNDVNSLVIIDQVTKEKVMTIQETGTVLNILVVPGSNKIITLKTQEITEHVCKNNYQNVCTHRIIETKEVKDNLMFLTIAVNKTGTLLFASTDDSRIICIDLKTNSKQPTHIFDLENRRGNVVSMDVSEIAVWNDFEPGSDILLTGTGTIENSAKVWNLDTSYVLQHTQKNGKVRLTKKFDVSFNIAQSPHTPSTTATNSTVQSASTTPKRAASFQHNSDVPKRTVSASLSLDRHALKPLNLRGICTADTTFQPLLAVLDDKNNIQVMRGRKVLTEIITQPEEEITTIKISPCNHYILYGLRSGIVKKYALRSKETKVVMDMNSSVQYLNFANPQLLIAGSKNCSLMAHRLTNDGDWKTEMMQCEKVHLGSQEILNDIQGIKKKNGQPDNLRSESSGSESSLASKGRIFLHRESKPRLRGICGLVECFYIQDVGLITVESNAVVKLWSQDMKLASVLNARQLDAQVTCAAFHKNVLAICDESKTGFTTFELKVGDQVELSLIQDYRLNNRITSCDLSEDGLILAMGLDTGEVVVWNVPGKRQLRLIKHHKSPVHCCAFSPAPARLHRSSSLSSPSPFASPPPPEPDDDAPPLVLVTMATEIVWWNVTYIMKMRANKTYWRTGRNAVTPLASPLDNKIELPDAMANLSLESSNNNFFFGNGSFKPQDCWKLLWKGKKYKEGSKNKEILACIKLTGMSAKKLCHDDKFSCFVTVDNSGRVHVMNAIRNT